MNEERSTRELCGKTGVYRGCREVPDYRYYGPDLICPNDPHFHKHKIGNSFPCIYDPTKLRSPKGCMTAEGPYKVSEDMKGSYLVSGRPLNAAEISSVGLEGKVFGNMLVVEIPREIIYEICKKLVEEKSGQI